ncbi:MAG: FAD-dependent oxidoreductase [Candidatus Jidaibacter sp.]|jgi:NADPH-dependent glutamate synthase beta subunit-like oxidoreductase/NAD(P)H-flavin reductase|nr:FAD-dependent oxidoreductase [Candidatus Jidaibacter sp.]
MLTLAFDLTFQDLYSADGIKKLHAHWLAYLKEYSEEYFYVYSNGLSLDKKAESQLIIDLSPILEDFIGELFGIKHELHNICSLYNKLSAITRVKRLFVQRQAVKQYKPEQIPNIELLEEAGINLGDELSFATAVEEWENSGNTEMLEHAKIYAGWATLHPDGVAKHKDDVLFKTPKKLEYANLISLKRIDNSLCSEHMEHRNGFNLNDHGVGHIKALDQANYCIHCHHQGKDSCSKGMKDVQTNSFKVNELKVNLLGCPLEEKISEMNLLKSQGSVIGALATAIIDNPMLAATGHRICNDCMKACIYQKQEPVNIPMVETQTLNDVLDLPWGFEIYSLLAKWNPLNFKHPHMKANSNYKVLVVGLGPAGFTMAHHMLNHGCTVVAVDGAKIEPYDPSISGIDYFGNRTEFKPIKYVRQEIFEDLETRSPQGFGGVAEYGITVRWDKNYLSLIRLMLERRGNFRMYGGIRFGGTIDYTIAKNLGFDHIALSMGAGKPNLPDVTNMMAKGCRTASDFLMSLQLSGAALKDSLANLQIRLPVLVIGGGLTAVDTATESLAYYKLQVEKFLQNYEKLGESIFDGLSEEDSIITKEFIEHGKAVKQNPDKAIELIKSWGGVKIIYRKTIQDSPAYRLNHEELEKGLAEGIEFLEHIDPVMVNLDEFDACESLTHKTGTIAARSIMIAAGTQPNTTLSIEDEMNFKLDGKYFQAIDNSLNVITPQFIAKPESVEIFTVRHQVPSVSYLGDLHPSFVGNVVKAMASAKNAAPIVAAHLLHAAPQNKSEAQSFFASLDKQLLAIVHKLVKLTDTIYEIIIHAPLAASQFKPGQFYKLQNFRKYAPHINGYSLAFEPLALTGAWIDEKAGIISLIVLEMGGSSNLCKALKIGEPVILMGPTGTPTDIPHNETVMLVGGGLGNAVLLSIGKALRKNGCKVVYFAGYKKAEDRFKQADIESASDITVWCCDESELSKTRSTDLSFYGNMLECIKKYSTTNTRINLKDVDRIIAIGSDKMMAAVAYARHNSLQNLFKESHIAIGSINSPMQCMMKQICGQCIQRHVDTETGEESYIYSCENQDQLLDEVDFKNLGDRLSLNSAQEQVCKKVIANLV